MRLCCQTAVGSGSEIREKKKQKKGEAKTADNTFMQRVVSSDGRKPQQQRPYISIQVYTVVATATGSSTSSCGTIEPICTYVKRDTGVQLFTLPVQFVPLYIIRVLVGGDL